MNQPDTPQTEELQRIACAPNANARIVQPEQLRAWLVKRRDEAVAALRSARRTAWKLENEVAEYEQLLAELTVH